MDFHILDLIMYIIIGVIIWLIQPDEHIEEVGCVIGVGILFIYTIIYLIIFAVFDVNWIDIFDSIGFPEINIKL